MRGVLHVLQTAPTGVWHSMFRVALLHKNEFINLFQLQCSNFPRTGDGYFRSFALKCNQLLSQLKKMEQKHN